MGIPKLNKILLEKCENTELIKKINLHELNGKTIAVDTSIYLYKFSAQERLIENFYLLISLFINYNITPLFVFDGKPPPEKSELLQKRKINKKAAQFKYDKLQEKLDSGEELSKNEINDINKEMDKLKKDFIRIKDIDIKNIQELLAHSGITYYTCEGEADLLCCKLVMSGQAWACLSDDMDLFVYGCTRILRYISILKGTVLCYDTVGIFQHLHMSSDDFKQIISLSGTDYNLENNINIYKCFEYYESYKKDSQTSKSFYNWLEKKNIIKNGDDLMEICNLFDTDIYIHHNKITNTKNMKLLNDKLVENDFVFV
jgi:flap endonuclease-1